MILESIIAFIAGALFEASCIGWAHYASKNKPWQTSICSMFAATMQLTGIVDSVHNILVSPFLILGYGVGTFIAIYIKEQK